MDEKNFERLAKYAPHAASAILAISTGNYISAIPTGFAVVGTAALDIINNVIGENRKIRTAQCLETIIDEIKKLQESEKAVRDDDFFELNEMNPSKATEVAESVFLKASVEYEHRKLKHLGIFYAKIAYDKNISANSAHYQLKIFQGLSYRQLCLLKLANSDKRKLLGNAIFERKGVEIHAEKNQIMTELINLHEKRLIEGEIKTKQINLNNDTYYEHNVIIPNTIMLDIEFGITFYEYFGIEDIQETDLDIIVNLIKGDT